MPPDNSFWLDDQQCAFPGAEDVCEKAEEESIGRSEMRFGRGSSKYFKLLSQIHDFQLESSS